MRELNVHSLPAPWQSITTIWSAPPACARAFAAEGARVAVHYHRGRDRAESLADEIGGAPILNADLTIEDDVDRLFEAAREALGRVDVCAAVAGVWPSEDRPVWDLPL